MHIYHVSKWELPICLGPSSPALKLFLVLEQNKIQTNLNLILILIFPNILRIKNCIDQITNFIIQEYTREHG